MDPRIGFDGCGWVERAIIFFNASLGTSILLNLMLVVLEGEKVRHVVSAHIFFAGTARGQLSMHH